MKKLLSSIALILLVAGLAGCDSGTPTGPDPGEGGRPVTAADIEDDTNKYLDTQKACPVCGGTPIKGEYYVDLPQGRVYFDKQECRNEFEQNQDQYLQEWHQRLTEQQAGERGTEMGRDPTPSN